MVSGPISILREALANLAAEPTEQARRLGGGLIQDELALDFANGFESLTSLPEADTLDDDLMRDLSLLYERLSVGPNDSLWYEKLTSQRWADIRSLALRLTKRL